MTEKERFLGIGLCGFLLMLGIGLLWVCFSYAINYSPPEQVCKVSVTGQMDLNKEMDILSGLPFKTVKISKIEMDLPCARFW